MRAWLVALAAAIAVLGCGKKAPQAGAGAAADAAPVAAAAPDAAVGVFSADVLSDPGCVHSVDSQAGSVDALIGVKKQEEAALTPQTPAITGEKPPDAVAADAGPAPVAVAAPDAGVAPVDEHDQGDFALVVQGDGAHPLRPVMVQTLGALVEILNSQLTLPGNVPVVVKACGTPNMFYDPTGKQIIVCDEMLPYMHEVFSLYKPEEEANIAALVALLGGFLHELGHCLIDQYQLPVIGREEDAADQLAALLVLGGPDNDAASPEFGLTLAEFWMAFTLARPAEKRNQAWDEHSGDEQRYYNILCLTYGSRPDAYAFIVDEGDLPRERGRRCAKEYQQIRKAWVKLLTPHLKKGAKF